MFEGTEGCFLCLGMPLFAILVGALVRTIGPIVEREVFKTEKKDEVSSLLALLITPMICIALPLVIVFIDGILTVGRFLCFSIPSFAILVGALVRTTSLIAERGGSQDREGIE